MSDKPTYEQLENKLKSIEQENLELNTLYKAVTTISSTLSLKDTLGTIARQISDALDTSGCSILLWNRDKNEIENLIDHNKFYPDEADSIGQTYDLKNYPAVVNVLTTGDTLLVRQDDPTADEAERALMKEQGIFTSLTLPLKTRKQVFGLLEIYEDVKPRKFTAREIKFAESLGFQAAAALENARLYEDAQNEIDKRIRIERELQESKELFDAFMRYLPALAFMKDMNGRYIYINQAYKNLYGVEPEELIGKIDDEIFQDDALDQIKENDRIVMSEGRALQGVEEVTFNGDTCHHMMSKFPILKNGQAIILAGIAFDITEQVKAERERERLEEQLQRSQKIEALGLLAGGVAHDLNNVLSGIVSYPELILLDLPERSSLREPILTIQKSGQKAAEIVQNLLTLTRRGVVIHTEALNLNHIISEYLSSPEHKKIMSYHPNVSIKTDLEEGVFNIKGSSIHLKKALMNMVSNAAEAQPQGGRINLTTENQYIDHPVTDNGNLEAGDYAVLKVEDMGEGIASGDVKKIFEPFYTKKVMGRSGTGLGMAVVWGTIQDHKGHINIESIEGKGTVIDIYLPATKEEIIEGHQDGSIDEFMGNKESILVVDDVEEQREIAIKMLHRLGYSVTAASSGKEAVEYLKKKSVDVVVLDMIMNPGIDGLETYKQIIEFRPNQKAVIASGFAETQSIREAQRIGAGQFIKKPYTMEKIGAAIKVELKG